MEETKPKRKSNTTARKTRVPKKKTAAAKRTTAKKTSKTAPKESPEPKEGSANQNSGSARPSSQARIAVQKEYALKVLQKNFGNVSLTCETIGISRFEFYKWRKDDPEFNKAVEDINEFSLDMVESAMMKSIFEEGNSRLIMFYLNSKGKKRGYGLKNESDGDKSGAVLLRISPDEAEY